MKTTLPILLILSGCALAPEFIPEPPNPEAVHYDPIERIEWVNNRTVIYDFDCTAGDARATFRLTFDGSNWNVHEPIWREASCPLR